MKNLFEPAIAREIKTRIASLTPESESQWGVMNVAQMLAHCALWMEIASGLKTSPRSFLGRIFGKLAKKSMLGQEPVRRNMPTDKILVVAGENDFFSERQRLLDRVEQFSTGGPEHCTTLPHSFFGSMTANEWAIMGYKHLDHHLQQFGA